MFIIIICICQYDVAVDETNEMLQSFIDDCETIHNKLFWLFRQHERINEKYSLKLLYAAGRVYDGMSAIKKCLRYNTFLLVCGMWHLSSNFLKPLSNSLTALIS